MVYYSMKIQYLTHLQRFFKFKGYLNYEKSNQTNSLPQSVDLVPQSVDLVDENNITMDTISIDLEIKKSKKSITKEDKLIIKDNESKLFECKQCGKKCKSSSNFNRHKKTHDINKYVAKCKFCDRRFIYNSELQTHIKTKHCKYAHFSFKNTETRPFNAKIYFMT